LLGLFEAFQKLVFLAESAAAGSWFLDSRPSSVLAREIRGSGSLGRLLVISPPRLLLPAAIVGLFAILHGLLGRDDSALVNGVADATQILIINFHRLIAARR